MFSLGLNPSIPVALEQLLVAPCAPKLLVLKARTTVTSDAWLMQALSESAMSHWHTSVHPCDRERMGSYSGVREVLLDLLDLARTASPDIIVRYAESLICAAPGLAEELDRPYAALCDRVPVAERTRFYHVERYLRVLNGLVDFTKQVCDNACDGKPIVIGLLNYDAAGYYAERYIELLVRRATPDRPLVVCLCVSEQGWDRIADTLSPYQPKVIAIDENPGAAVPVKDLTPAEHLASLQALESAPPPGARNVLAPYVYHAVRSGDPALARKYLIKAAMEAMCLANYVDVAEYVGQLSPFMTEEASPQEWRLFVTLQTNALSTQNQHARTLDIYEQLVRRYPDDIDLRVWASYGMAISLSRYMGGEANHERAEAIMNEAGDLLQQHWASVPEPEFKWAFHLNGLALVKRNRRDYAKALDLCLQGERILRETYGEEGRHRLHRSVLLFNIGQLYAGMNDVETALNYYDQSLAIDSTYPEVLVERANLCRSAGRYEEALATYNHVETISPPWWDLHLNRALLYMDMGRDEEAMADLRCAVDLNPGLAQAWENLGALCYSHGLYTEALRCFNQALELNPHNAAQRTNRGLVYQAMKAYTLARLDYETVTTAEPTYYPAHLNLATLYYECGDTAAAYRELDLAVSLAPEEPAAWANRGLLKLESGQWEAALADFEQALRLDPDDADTLRWQQQARKELKRRSADPA